jgi:phosphohistidine phosphatase
MKLYLVQHGEAKSEQEDPRRGLTDQGKRNIQKTADFFAKLSPELGEIRHSTKLRAAETAQLLAGALGKEDLLRECEGLAPNDPVKPLAQELDSVDRPLLVVGHLPFLSKLASLLLCGDEGRAPITFSYAGIVCLGRNEDRWQVEWIFTPDLL